MALYKSMCLRSVSLFHSEFCIAAKFTFNNVDRGFLSSNSRPIQPNYVQIILSKLFKSTKTPQKPIKPVKNSTFAFNIAEENEDRKHRHKTYSPEDDEYILKQIEINGDNKRTHKQIANVLGVSETSISNRYNGVLSGKKFVKGKFTPEEDKIILDHINEHGSNRQSLKQLMEILNRCSAESLRCRHKKLLSENEYDTSNASKKKSWELAEEEKILRYVIRLKRIKNHDIEALESIKVEEFSSLAKDLQRSKLSCFTHWMQVVLPALKSHILGIPYNSDWKLELMNYIVDNKIKHENDIDIDYLVKNVTPGQTRFSVQVYEKTFRDSWTGKGYVKERNMPLYKLVENKLILNSHNNPALNKNSLKGERTIKKANDIIFLYNLLVS